jgi:hypothetical protein
LLQEVDSVYQEGVLLERLGVAGMAVLEDGTLMKFTEGGLRGANGAID